MLNLWCPHLKAFNFFLKSKIISNFVPSCFNLMFPKSCMWVMNSGSIKYDAYHYGKKDICKYAFVIFPFQKGDSLTDFLKLN